MTGGVGRLVRGGRDDVVTIAIVIAARRAVPAARPRRCCGGRTRAPSFSINIDIMYMIGLC